MNHQPEFVSLHPPAVTSAVASKSNQGQLPFTGVDVGALVLAGLILLGAGVAQRRLLRD